MLRPVLPILLLLLLVLPAGCGKKGPVRPLRQPLPSAPGDLTVEQRGQRFLVTWVIPRTNQDGSPLEDLQGFQVYKMKFDPAEDCPECRDTSLLLLTADLEYLQDVARTGDRLYLWDAELEPGFGYQYRVVPYNRKGRAGEPVQKRVPFLNPPTPPTALTAAGHDRLVRLQWEPATETRQGVALLGYNLYRRQLGESFPILPVNRSVLTEPSFEDFGVENGTTYLYAVRTVARIMDNTVESSLSQTTEAVPKAGM